MKNFAEYTPDELNRINDENLFDYIKVFCQAEIMEFIDSDEILSVMNDINGISMITNCVNRARFRGAKDDVDAKVGEVLDRYKSKGLPLMWTVGPTSEPDDLGDYLLKHKLMHVDTYTKMALDLDAFQSEMRIPDGLEILEVTGKDILDKWFNIYSVSFELSWLIEKALKKFYAGIFLDKSVPTSTYIGFYKGRPVATSQVFINSECAGIYNIDTQPEARGLGIGYAMTLKTLLRAKESGCKTATLQATKKGYPVYKKLGFTDTGKSDGYVKTYGKSQITVPASFIARIATNAMRPLFIRL